jgi:3-hydroxy-9,10-secoandrosta-1,3,5(10)-triene-9,17-dione monooxygenase reductase component
MEPSSAQEKRALRDALGSFSTGVTVITTHDEQGQALIGLTVNSFSSVSLDPPLVLWSISNQSPNVAHFSVGRQQAIHVLSKDQEALARHFATTQADKFSGVDHQAPGDFGAPLFDGCSARFYCVTESVVPAGDHQIILARVLRYESEPVAPLLFVRGAFATI